MKYILSFSILLMTSSIFSQGLTDKYASFDITIGRKSLSVDEGNYTLRFVEESIREIAYDLDNTYKSKIGYTDLKLGIKFGKYKGLSHELFFDVTIGGHGGGQFGYSLGYNFALEPGNFDILIRPSLGISTGDVGMYFNKFGIDTIGVVLNDNDYFETDVKINLEHNVVTLTPNLELTFLFEQRYAFTLNVGYDYVVRAKDQQLAFHPKEEGYPGFDSPFDSDTYIFRSNNEPVTDNIFSSSSLKYSIGISSYLNRD